MPADEPIIHPDPHMPAPIGIECIEITEYMNYNLGTAVSFIWRADREGQGIVDLRQAVIYLEREIERRKKYLLPSEVLEDQHRGDS